MKNITSTLTLNTEHLGTLIRHMDKKEAGLREEPSDCLQKVYEKHVPQTTREYPDDKIARKGATKSARLRRQVKKSHARN